MALDTGRIADLDFEHGSGATTVVAERSAPTLNDGRSIGQALKAVREHLRLSLEDVAEDTRIRRAYLAALEDGRLDALPSRPFTVGYVRAYAKALGLDGEAAVERFRTEEPAPDQALPEPLGVQDGRDPRLMLGVVALAVIIGAIVLWNVVQRLMAEPPPPPPVAAYAPHKPKTVQSAQAAAVALGAPLPPPVESTTPPLYETPGLAAATAAGDGSADAAEADLKARKAAAAQSPPPAVEPETLPATFVAKGAVYGGPADTSPVVIQARKPASIIVRGADGSVYFARQLAAGEAYRAPTLPGLTLDVSDPASFQVFVAGETKGVLHAPQTPVSKLAAE